MRLIVMYDLPMTTTSNIRDYNKFRNLLFKEGFIMIQESVYCKLFLNQDQLKYGEKSLKKLMPKKGNIRSIAVTEKQYQNMIIHVGSKTNNELIMNDRRLQEI
jgi:CRISPR-associated protein Cas2